MTNVAFHFNVMDKIFYACRLLRKATRQGAKVTVTGDNYSLGQIDDALWTFDQLEFLPHCDAEAPKAVLSRTNIVLAKDVRQSPHADVLVNLGVEMPTGFERYLRLIELVGVDQSDRGQARQRWRHYSSRGYPIQTYEVTA